MVWLEPTRSNDRSCSTRSSLACSGSSISVTSSSRIVPLVGQLEAAGAGVIGPGERAALVAEQFAFHQMRREGTGNSGSPSGE